MQGSLGYCHHSVTPATTPAGILTRTQTMLKKPRADFKRSTQLTRRSLSLTQSQKKMSSLWMTTWARHLPFSCTCELIYMHAYVMILKCQRTPGRCSFKPSTVTVPHEVEMLHVARHSSWMQDANENGHGRRHAPWYGRGHERCRGWIWFHFCQWQPIW